MPKIVLLSDVGGTNARFELRRMDADGSDELLGTATYPTVTPDAAPGSGSGTSLHFVCSDKYVGGMANL